VQFPPQRLVQPRAHIPRNFLRFAIAENPHRRSRLMDDLGAFFAVIQVLLEFLFRRSTQFAVEVVRNLENHAFAIQFGSP
jgi:hypothetical protein